MVNNIYINKAAWFVGVFFLKAHSGELHFFRYCCFPGRGGDCIFWEAGNWSRDWCLHLRLPWMCFPLLALPVELCTHNIPAWLCPVMAKMLFCLWISETVSPQKGETWPSFSCEHQNCPLAPWLHQHRTVGKPWEELSSGYCPVCLRFRWQKEPRAV